MVLRGKRIGYPHGGNAHYTLLEALADANLGEKDVHLVPLDVSEMPDALANGEIAAFCAWEPIPTATLARPGAFAVIHRSLSTSYMYFTRQFAEKRPEAVRQVVASQLRSMGWMREQRQNLLEACKWAMQAGSNFSGKTSILSVEQYARLTQEDILDLRSAPMIPEYYLKQDGPLYREFRFLISLGKIPSSSNWDSVRSSFDNKVIEEVLMNAEKYELDGYYYDVDGGENE